MYLKNDRADVPAPQVLSPGAAWLTLEALSRGERHIAWKTGTSFGFRDAWAVGVNADWTVAVWAGNASGEGRPELLGASAAAPAMFEVFSFLETEAWFPKPPDLASVECCAASGYPAGENCAELVWVDVPEGAARKTPCPYCVTLVLNEDESAQVRLGGGYTGATVTRKRFVLPPGEAWYYRRRTLGYRDPPPFAGQETRPLFALFYPEEGSALYVPREIDGKQGRVVFLAAHGRSGARLFWHIDDIFAGETTGVHELELHPAVGEHIVTVVDESGQSIRRRFSCWE
jgi:penicillin-binding protein 1C